MCFIYLNYILSFIKNFFFFLLFSHFSLNFSTDLLALPCGPLRVLRPQIKNPFLVNFIHVSFNVSSSVIQTRFSVKRRIGPSNIVPAALEY